ncbi:MAG: TAXI family TRAP transporter solute-binding subunit, partial [Rhodospirillales bacterium]
PILITLAGQDDVLVYSMTKAINSEYSKFKDAMPELKGWALERQAFKWAVPYHKAAVKYWKEIGAWTGEMEAYNNKLLKRQEVLAAAWAGTKNSKAEGDAFKKEWEKIRAEALKKAGFIP